MYYEQDRGEMLTSQLWPYHFVCVVKKSGFSRLFCHTVSNLSGLILDQHLWSPCDKSYVLDGDGSWISGFLKLPLNLRKAFAFTPFSPLLQLASTLGWEHLVLAENSHFSLSEESDCVGTKFHLVLLW